jgi:Uma2 family endonuclease
VSQAAQRLRTTFAEFCDRTAPDDRRYELFDGQILAMNQPSPRYARLTISLGKAVDEALSGQCTVLGPVGIYCEQSDDGFGPDLVVICEPPRLDPVRGRALVNPRAIIEILSPSTETIDKGHKLRRYRTLTSLHEYVLVSQDERLVQVYRRSRDGWLWQGATSGTFELCGAAVSVEAIYEGVEAIPFVR